MKILVLLIIVAMLAGCATSVPALQHVYIEQVSISAQVDSTVSAYEQSAHELRAIHTAASRACKSGDIPAKQCTRFDVIYQETRTAFIAAGNRYKELLKAPSDAARLRYNNANTEFGALLKQLKDMCTQNGITTEVAN